ncbi:hypothetical protein PHJA_001577300 [Phtheirospermum japonicum]|uniref:Uncharacterized protein n=1 Tax=Phtheirospermum japonicum TaxID=374723 RepID=A0A830CBC2_9LAMI|nr:hypothetical protein PHJA_001577300 [Phtheirospermum japonicum]
MRTNHSIYSGACLALAFPYLQKGNQEGTRVVEEKHESSSNNPPATHAQGTENADKSTSIKQGNAFDLFKIFSNGKEKDNEKDSQDEVLRLAERVDRRWQEQGRGRFHLIKMGLHTVPC